MNDENPEVPDPKQSNVPVLPELPPEPENSEQEFLQPEPDMPEPAPLPEEPRSRFSRNRLILVIFGLVLIAGIGFAAAVITENDGNEQPTASPNEQPAQTTEPESDLPDDIQVSTVTKTFKTEFPRVEFTYPDNWVVTANTEQEGVRIESPEFNYTTINGGTVRGLFRIYIRQGARQEDSKYIGRGYASQDSEVLTYTEPAVGQRAETNLSFFGLDTPDNFAYFMIAGNFSLKKSESLGPEYGREPDTYIISGGYSSKELTEDMATNQVTTEYFSQTNAYKQAIDIVESLKLL